VRLSLKSQYAICGVFDLAYNGDALPIQVRVIGERQKIPARYLEQIFQSLRRADLVKGKRGPGGGYVLTRPAAEITLRDIVEAVEGPLGESLGAGPPPRDRREANRPGFVWHDLASRVGDALEGITIESLCRRAAAGAVQRADSDDRIWHI
jgi:Rrf2 family protein